MGIPTKIGQIIVGRIAIFVTPLHAFWAWTDERFKDKTMNCIAMVFSVPAKPNCQSRDLSGLAKAAVGIKSMICRYQTTPIPTTASRPDRTVAADRIAEELFDMLLLSHDALLPGYCG